MLDCLQDLADDVKKKKGHLYLFEGPPEKVVDKLLDLKVDAVFVNRDYTPFSIERSFLVEKLIFRRFK